MSKPRIALIIVTVTVLLLGGLAFEIVTTQPVRGAVRTCSELFTIANRPDLEDSERLDAARLLCSKRYLEEHPLEVAPEGGLVNMPRNLNKNFKAWREGKNVLLCTSNRIGAVYRFVYEEGRWRFDGLVGILRSSGEIVRASDLPPQPAY
jgi:hypothetical protein